MKSNFWQEAAAIEQFKALRRQERTDDERLEQLYSARFRQREADQDAQFMDRVWDAAGQIDSRQKTAGALLDSYWRHCKSVDKTNRERRDKLDAWHKELRSWQDRWNSISGGPRDPEQTDKPDPKIEQRDAVEQSVRDAIREHSSDESV